MGQYTSYYLYQRYESRDGQRAIPSIPSYYSIDGDGTMERVIKMENDTNCGYVPPPAEPTYRWYQLPISQDYVCDSCGYVPPTPTGETIYRWVESGTTCVEYDKWNRSIEQYSEDSGVTWYNTNPPVYSATSLIEVDSTDCGVSYRWIDLNPSTDYYCSGTTKYYKQQKQKSYDGTTWENVTPVEYQWGGSAETESMDCGYIPPTTIKLKSTYSDSTVKFAECDASSAITSGEIITNNLVSVEIGDCVTTIGDRAFAYCGSLTSITIPNSVTHIGYGAFEYTNITNLYIPDSVTSIGDVGGSALEMNGAFGHNSGLTEVVIGSGITSIAEYSFDDTPSLTSVTINATTPPTTSEWVFGGNVNPNFRIQVPCESINSYKTAEFWNTYKQYITGIGECPQVGHKFDITYMDNTTYYLDCDSTSAITSAETSGSQSKSNIKSVAIGNCVSSIGDSVFNGATSLSSVTIGSGVTLIGNNSFSNCWSLQNINLTSVSTFGYNAFYNCTGMTSVELGSGVTYVTSGAFYINTLTSVTIHAANPPRVSFYNLTGPFYGSCPIYVPKESVEVYKNNINWRNLGLSSRVQPIGGWGDLSILKASFSDGTSAYTLECGGSTTLDRNTFDNLPSTAMISMVVGECARNIQATSLSPSTFNTLTSVTISSDNLTIGYDVFENFTSISSFTLTTLTPPTLQARPNYSYTMAFDGTNFPILVPCESLDTYKTDSKWSRYASRIHGIEPDCE